MSKFTFIFLLSKREWYCIRAKVKFSLLFHDLSNFDFMFMYLIEVHELKWYELSLSPMIPIRNFKYHLCVLLNQQIWTSAPNIIWFSNAQDYTVQITFYSISTFIGIYQWRIKSNVVFKFGISLTYLCCLVDFVRARFWPFMVMFSPKLHNITIGTQEIFIY